jgi:hypothetical protein
MRSRRIIPPCDLDKPRRLGKNQGREQIFSLQ